ncbi:hypothetical protein CCHR01_12229 [Colletotrichum chrysophilum]|uniref:Uncharacterized protein n=1 Tax=Colletotrichum chrysophilum TaxID=1836956 RepID=A0AAD9EBK8_9PEZI|nr:hypothetical protein CCHR01_12229 [Colletotrichum chrysophilum]
MFFFLSPRVGLLDWFFMYTSSKPLFLTAQLRPWRRLHVVSTELRSSCVYISDPKWDVAWETHLQEPSHEVVGQPLVSSKVLLLEVGHDVRGLLPEVHRLLVFGVALEDQDVDDGELLGEPVALKLLAYPGAKDGDGKGDVVHRLDLGRLANPFSVGSEDPSLCVVPVGRLPGRLGELGRCDGHGGRARGAG